MSSKELLPFHFCCFLVYIFRELPDFCHALLDTTYDPKAEATKMSLNEFSLETASYLFTVQEQLLHCPEYAAVFGLSPVVMKMGNR